MILHSLYGEEGVNLVKKRLLAPYARMIPINVLFLMLLLPDQLVSSYELAVVPKYFHSTPFNSNFCILLQVSAGLDIKRYKWRPDMFDEIH